MRRILLALAPLAGAAALSVAPAAPAAPSAADPYCTASYGGLAPRPAPTLRFGIDPGLAGSAGGAQLPSTPDDPARDLVALEALRPSHRVLVVRLNRLFESDGDAGIERFRTAARNYAGHGFSVEVQVRYHPSSAENGDMAAWTRFVRRVVDRVGRVPGVIAMTVTNEVNVPFSPNTSDGSYTNAQQAVVSGIEAAHEEARRVHRPALRFGFTYAYRFSPQGDANFFTALRNLGGPAFLRALGFIGLDFYPGAIYPPVMAPGDTYRADLSQAAGTVRDCYMPMAGIGTGTPIWITETGVSTGSNSDAQQAAAAEEILTAARDYARTYGITDVRWFNLRDTNSSGPETLLGPTFASFGLLRDDYSRKPSFGVVRSLIASFGTPQVRPRHPAHRRHRVRRRTRRRTLRRRRES